MNEHRALRNAFGQFGTGVVIITITDHKVARWA